MKEEGFSDMANEARRDRAEALAAEMLAFVSERPEAAARWFSESGLCVEDLRGALGRADSRSQVLAGVFDFVMSDEALASEFAAERRLAPEDLGLARGFLSGGDAPHWL